MIKYFIISSILIASVALAVWEELKVSIPQADVHQWANRLIEYIDTITLDLAKERFYGLVNQGFPPAQAFDIIVESAK